MRFNIATFNLENLDFPQSNYDPKIEERIVILRPQLTRLRADVLCFQEVHSQGPEGQRELSALKKLLENTPYENYHFSSTRTQANEYYRERNLVTISRFPIIERKQIREDYIEFPHYKKIMATPPENEAHEVIYQRPILYNKIEVDSDFYLHIINVHFKSRRPTNIKGEKINDYTWRSSCGWAEGFFLSSMKRMAQALETRFFIDTIFDAEENAKLVVCGDFNAHPDEPAIEALCGKVENTGNAELNSRVLFSCENSISDSTRYTYLHMGKKRLLDHMLMSLNMVNFYTGSEIHNENLSDESVAFAFDKKFPGSDHAPFVTKFEIE